jgi:hypothetical protein
MMQTLTPRDLRGLAAEVENGAPPPYVSTRLRQMADKLEDRHSDGQPHARSTDRATSQAAARSTQGRQTLNQDAVVRVFRSLRSATDEQFIDEYRRRQGELALPRQQDSGLRTRRRELADVGVLRDSGRTTQMRSGRWATVWELVPARVEPPPTTTGLF